VKDAGLFTVIVSVGDHILLSLGTDLAIIAPVPSAVCTVPDIQMRCRTAYDIQMPWSYHRIAIRNPPRHLVRWRTDTVLARVLPCRNHTRTEIAMYIGGGLLGTVLLILLIVWLVRRV
jgi:hypothetical protein